MSRKRLKTLEDARRYLSNLINRTEGGEVEPQLAAKLGYLTNILISCIKDSDLESRIERLEQLTQTKGKGGNVYELKK